MYKSNPKRLSIIRDLRAKGLTIGQIAAATGYPRSSVGYYVARYCGGRIRSQKQLAELTRPEPASASYVIEPEPRTDRVDAYLQSIENKERLSVTEILEGRKRGDELFEEFILDMFWKDPWTFYIKLRVLVELIRLAPYLRLNLDRMRDTVALLVSEESTANSAGS